RDQVLLARRSDRKARYGDRAQRKTNRRRAAEVEEKWGLAPHPSLTGGKMGTGSVSQSHRRKNGDWLRIPVSPEEKWGLAPYPSLTGIRCLYPFFRLLPDPRQLTKRPDIHPQDRHREIHV